MSSLPLPWLANLLGLAFVCLIIGGGSYFLLRLAELRFPVLMVWVSFLGSFSVLMGLNLVNSRIAIIAFCTCTIAATSGIYFHHKSSNTSYHWASAFFFLMFVSVVTGSVEWIVLEQSSWFSHMDTPPALSFLDNSYFWSFFLQAPVFLSPFLCWAAQRMHPRPGKDHHLEEPTKKDK